MIFSIKIDGETKDIEFRFNEDNNTFADTDYSVVISVVEKNLELSSVYAGIVESTKFISIDGSEIKLEFVKQLLINYNYTSITQLIDTEIIDGCWVDDDWEDDGDFSDEYEWYGDFGRGEAEDVVMEEIINFLIDKVGITNELYLLQTNENMYETIQNMFPKLETV